ncbi:RSP_7527 family protein [Reyranella sp.]|jgi:hypothetical protein|nr:hypothetical protein [Reyranella sp.]MDO8973989.1 hypothetical protein [Reyranella sp.]
MFTVPYPSITERRALEARAHRLRSAAVAHLFRGFSRWVSAAAR